MRPFFGRNSTPLKYKYLIFILLQNQVWRRPATELALGRRCHCFIVLPRSGTWSELSLFRRQHRPAAVNYLTLSVMPALIVSGARSMTALSSPVIQKPHLSQTPAASPAHTALLVPSVKMKLLIRQAFLKFRSRMWRRTERTANINEKVPSE